MRIGELRALLGDYVGFVPGLLVTLVVAAIGGGWAGRVMHVGRAHGTILLLALGVIVSATLTPGRDAILYGIQGSGTCDLSRIGFPPLWQFRFPSESLLNILLFVPLGAALGWCPPSRPKRIALIAAYAMPFAIEAIQLVVTPLGRECQSSDVIDNLTGLTIGVLVAVAGRVLLR